MKTNPWSLPKDRALRRLLLSLAAHLPPLCEVEPDACGDPRMLTLRHPTLTQLRAHVFLHGQHAGAYGLFYEYPHPVPGILESEENLPLAKVLEQLHLHFDA